MLDYLIVGAGLTGATLARRLWQAGKLVKVIERRGHVAGNCYDELMDGIRVHQHGGHIFHTNSERVWRFVTMFAKFRQYEHRVKAYRSGRYYSFPPNKMTEQQLGYGKGVNLALMYQELFYEDFSEKVWGKSFKDLPETILRRVPIRIDWDDRYYTDKYQGLPRDGYTRLVEMLLHDIEVETDVDFGTDYSYWRRQAEKVIYTGALDELMQEQFGRLEYRSLTFETTRMEVDDYQGCPTVNYPAPDVAYTVVNEWKHYGWQTEPEGHTMITAQTPAAFEDTGERYYPYVDEENRVRHAKYVAALEEGIIPAGRLGRFQYLNMDQAIGAALALADKELNAKAQRGKG